MKHGFDENTISSYLLKIIDYNNYVYFNEKRYQTNGKSLPIEKKQTKELKSYYQTITDWKTLKNRKKTVNGLLVLCLNLEINSIDLLKGCSTEDIELFFSDGIYDTRKTIELIGNILQSQYKTFSSRTLYNLSLCPSVDDLKKNCSLLRKNAKNDYILFHYNGHGVPYPTKNGNIWVFNESYTQCIPVSIYDLQNWIGAPVIFVYDCSNAGCIVYNFKKFVQKRIDDDNNGKHDLKSPSMTSSYLDCFHLASCGNDETLPMRPDFPFNLFTHFLTSPIEISVKWFIMQSPIKKEHFSSLPTNSVGDVIIPGDLNDRKTPLGELNWIFTTITDSIAWSSLSLPIFKKLFRQDLMISGLFRNFILAKRIMPYLNCNPISDPPLPESIRYHNLWNSWDFSIDQILSYLLKIQEPSISFSFNYNTSMKKNEKENQISLQNLFYNKNNESNLIFSTKEKKNFKSSSETITKSEILNIDDDEQVFTYTNFFEQQLTSFEIWLKYTGPLAKTPPDQLPIIVQVLFLKKHRLKTLKLLSGFLNLGPWTIYHSLSIGIIPNVLKLLRNSDEKSKICLIYIWTKIMAVDYKNVQNDLLKDEGYSFFYSFLNYVPSSDELSDLECDKKNELNTLYIYTDQNKAYCAFILTLFIKNFVNGQNSCFSIQLIDNCMKNIQNSKNFLLKKWCILLLSEFWNNNINCRWIFYKNGYLSVFLNYVNDNTSEIRASVVLALKKFLTDIPTQKKTNDECKINIGVLNQQNLIIARLILKLIFDGSPIVRNEVVFFLNKFILMYINFFLVVLIYHLQEEILLIDKSVKLNDFKKKSLIYGTVFNLIWKSLLILSEDPHLEVKQNAEILIDLVVKKLEKSILSRFYIKMKNYLINKISFNVNDLLKTTHNQSIDLDYINNSNDIKLNKKNFNYEDLTNDKFFNFGSVFTSTKSDYQFLKSLKKTVGSDTSPLFKNIFSFFKLFNKDSHKIENEKISVSQLNDLDYKSDNYGKIIHPTPVYFKTRDLKENTQLSNSSDFFLYSCEYFQEPQKLLKEGDEIGSKCYNEKNWRYIRNKSIIQDVYYKKDLIFRNDWRNNVITFDNKLEPKIVKFAQFEQLLITGDEKGTVYVWDWGKKYLIGRFFNGDCFESKLTEIMFLNENSHPLLLTGSSNGMIKIYKNFFLPENYEIQDYESEDDKIHLLSSWRALTDFSIKPNGIGLILDWQQLNGSLLVAGNLNIIKIWDVQKEVSVSDISVQTTSLIKCLTSDHAACDIFVAGFDDGTIRAYDRRINLKDSMIKLWDTNNEITTNTQKPRNFCSIIKIHMQIGNKRDLVSGSTNGNINFWDLRMDKSILNFYTHENSLKCLDIHDYRPILVSGFKNISIWSTSGNLLSTAKFHESYLKNRIFGYLSNICFHPYKMIFATSYIQNTNLNIYSLNDTNSNY